MVLILEPRMEVQELVQERCKFKNCSRTTVQELYQFNDYSSRTSTVQELHPFKNNSLRTTQVHEPKFLKFKEFSWNSCTVQELIELFS